MYQISMACSAKIYDIAQLVSTSLPKAQSLRIIRYLNAAHTAGYVGLSHTYSKEEFFDYLNRAHCFLTPREMSRINEMDMDYGPDACHEILQWCMMEITKARRRKQQHDEDDNDNEPLLLDARDAGALKEKVIQFRSSMGSLFDYCDQPIHFFYIHFLVLLSTCYLPLFAIDSAYNAGSGNDVHWGVDLLNAMIVMLQSVFVIGLRVLGQKMVDPFGDDVEDLSVLHYIREAWQKSNRILNAVAPDEIDPALEETLERGKKISIGYAWESTGKKEQGGLTIV